MKPNLLMTRSAWSACLRQAIAWVTLGSLAVLGQTIPNPSFEADTFTGWPGYISLNHPITGWTASPEDKAGLNPASGSPFADNGSIPDGNNVAFIQWSDFGTTLSTTISDLTVGTTYAVTFRVNSRGGNAPNLRVSVDSLELLALTAYSAGGANPYWYVAFEFTAAAAAQTLTLLNDALADNTVLVDDFKIAPSAGKWWAEPWTSDEDSGVDASYFYTHAYNFGNSANVVINEITFTGIGGPGPTVPGQFSTTFLTSGPVFDDSVNISGESANLAAYFVYGGTIPVGSYQSITLQGLSPGTEYVATIYTVAWEDASMPLRWATFSAGEDRLTLNQDQLGNNNALRISYRYTADASGSVTLKFVPINPNNVSIHVYGFCNREAISRFVAPVIAVQPQGVTVASGQPASFTVAANGTPAPTYQWRFNGQNLPGANSPTFSLDTALETDAGGYDAVVANVMGSRTSVVARLVIGLPMTNPSFEQDSFAVFPGYVSDNGPITGWNALPNAGINPGVGFGPFTDNGAIPHGNQAAFLQGDGALSQWVGGFVVGDAYYLHYFENSRNCCNGTWPFLEVKLGGNTLVPAHGVAPVLGGNPYHEVFSDVFVATSTDTLLEFIKSNPQTGDTTALVDNAAFVRVAPGTPPLVTWGPTEALVSVGDSITWSIRGVGTLPLSFQWFKNGAPIPGATGTELELRNLQKPDEADYSAQVINAFGVATSAAVHLTVYEPIPDLFGTGLDDNHTPAADGAADPHYRLIDNPDTGSSDAIVEDSLAFPIIAGPWLANTAKSKWIGPRLNTAESAIGLYTYRTTINLTDRDPSTVIIEGLWATDNAGRDIRVNGVSTGNPQNNGFGAYTPFVIRGTDAQMVAGPNIIDFIVENVAAIGYTGLKVEIVRSNVRVPPGTPPEILTHPLSQEVSEGDTVTFLGEARGTAPLSYQWLKNGTPLPGQTGLTLTLSGVTTADAGLYALSVSNPVGTRVSRAAELAIVRRPIPAGFSTGIDANGTLLSAGEVDPHYTLTASADPNFPGPDAIVVNDAWPIAPGVWLLNGPNSKWIAPQADQGAGNYEGEYIYRTTVDLTGYNPALVILKGGWAVDNEGRDILVNGVSSGLGCLGFGGLTPFTIQNGLVAGVNTLEFVVYNAPVTLNPTALRVDLKAYVSLRLAMTVKKEGQEVVVSWSPAATGQQLQAAPTVSGPWQGIPNATPPYRATPTQSTQFFRVLVQ